MEKMTKQLAKKSEDPETGAFIGFDSSNESDQDEVYDNIIKNVLDFQFIILSTIFLVGWKHVISRSFRWITDVARKIVRRINATLLYKLLARVHCQVKGRKQISFF